MEDPVPSETSVLPNMSRATKRSNCCKTNINKAKPTMRFTMPNGQRSLIRQTGNRVIPLAAAQYKLWEPPHRGLLCSPIVYKSPRMHRPLPVSSSDHESSHSTFFLPIFGNVNAWFSFSNLHFQRCDPSPPPHVVKSSRGSRACKVTLSRNIIHPWRSTSSWSRMSSRPYPCIPLQTCYGFSTSTLFVISLSLSLIFVSSHELIKPVVDICSWNHPNHFNI